MYFESALMLELSKSRFSKIQFIFIFILNLFQLNMENENILPEEEPNPNETVEKEMMEIINKPIIDAKTQDIMDNMNERVAQKIDDFGVMFNPDGSEKTREQLDFLQIPSQESIDPPQEPTAQESIAQDSIDPPQETMEINSPSQIDNGLTGPSIDHGTSINPPSITVSEQEQALIDAHQAKIIKKLAYPPDTGPGSKLAWDIPRIYAFEIESRLKSLIKDLLAPMMHLNKVNTERQYEFKKYLEWIRKGQDEIQNQFEQTISLKDMVKDSQKLAKNLQKQQNTEIDHLHKRISDMEQLVKVHETKLIKFTDDKVINEKSRNQLRRDIREFEILIKDVSYRNNLNNITIKQETKDELMKFQDQLDQMVYENQQMSAIIYTQKDGFQKFQNKMGWLDFRLEELNKITEDLPPLYNQMRNTDKYLHKILPIHIQNEIFNSQKASLKKHDHLPLFKYTESRLEELEKLLKDEEIKFDKSKFKVPYLKEEIIDLEFYTQEYKENEEKRMQSMMKKRKGSSDSETESDEEESEEEGEEEQSEEEEEEEESEEEQSEKDSEEEKSEKDSEVPEVEKSESDSEEEKASGVDLKQEPEETPNESQVNIETPKESQVNIETPKESQVNIETPKESQMNIETPEENLETPKESQVTPKESQQNEEIPKEEPSIDKSEKPSASEMPSPPSFQSSISPPPIQRSISQSPRITPEPKKIKIKKKVKKPVKPKAPKISSAEKKKLKKSAKLNILAKRIGNRLLTDDNFINYVTDRQDGIVPEIPFYDSDEEDKIKLFKNSLKLNVMSAMKKFDLPKVETPQVVEERLETMESNKAPIGSVMETSQSNNSLIEKPKTKKKVTIYEPKDEESESMTNPAELISQEELSSPNQLESRESVMSPGIPGQEILSPVLETKSPDSVSVSKLRESPQIKVSLDKKRESPNLDTKRESPKVKRESPPPKLARKSESPSPNLQQLNISPAPIQPKNRTVKAAVRKLSEMRLINKSPHSTNSSIKPRKNEQLDKMEQEMKEMEDKFTEQILALETKVKSLETKFENFANPEIYFDEENSSTSSKKTVEEVKENNLSFAPSPMPSSSPGISPTPSGMAFDPEIFSKFATKTDLLKFQQQINDSRKTMSKLSTKIFQEELNRGEFVDNRLKTELAKLTITVDEMLSLRTYVATAQDQLELLKHECKSELKRVMRQGFQVNQSYEKQIEIVQQMNGTVQELQSRMGLADASFATIFKLLRIQYALMHQDEVDKQSIYLMGTKDDKPDQDINSMRKDLINGSQSLKVDKNCVHNQNNQQIPILKQGFKMACLNYQPSEILFDKKMFQRNQLVEAQGYLLYLALQQMQHIDFEMYDKQLLGRLPDDKHSLQHNLNITQNETSFNDESINIFQGSNIDSINSELHTSFEGPKQSIVLDSSSKKLISYHKSKEYSKLAAKAPIIYNIKTGQKYLHDQNLMMAGIKTENTVQDKYHRNIQHLKQIQQFKKVELVDLNQTQLETEHKRNRSILYSQVLRNQKNLTTTPEEVSVQYSISSQKNLLNELHENPFTPVSYEAKKQSKTPRRLAKISGGMISHGQIDTLITPRRVNNCLSTRPIVRNSQAMEPKKGFLGTYGYNENSMNVLPSIALSPNSNIKIEFSRNNTLRKDSINTNKMDQNLDLEK